MRKLKVETKGKENEKVLDCKLKDGGMKRHTEEERKRTEKETVKETFGERGNVQNGVGFMNSGKE
jgi:hypothetical protein